MLTGTRLRPTFEKPPGFAAEISMDNNRLIAFDKFPVCNPEADRRAAQRHPILQRCFVRPAAGKGGDGWKAIAYDLSTGGIGVAVPYPLAVGTILIVEPSGLSGAKTIEARVVRTAPLAHLWLLGCEVAVPLTDVQLREWLAGWEAETAATLKRYAAVKGPPPAP
jgi:hypothetical protein